MLVELKLRISKLTLSAPRGQGENVKHITLLLARGEVKIVNLLLGMSYNMTKMLSSKFYSHIIKIENFKMNPIKYFYPISTNGEVNF